MKKVFRSEYFKWGATIFLAGALLIVFFQIVDKYGGFKTGLSTLITIISPFLYGFVMAYLLDPLYSFIISKTYPGIKGATEKPSSALKISKIIATIVSLVVLFGVVIGIGALIIPQLIESVTGLSQTLPGDVTHFTDIINNYLDNMENDALADTLQDNVEELQNHVISWVQDTFLPGMGSLVQRVSSGLIVTIKTILNMVIGVIACVYYLNGKETFMAQFKKTILALFREDRAKEIFEFADYTNKTFGAFISGKILDSLIIGILCFIAMSILKLPYSMLISTIVGITNVIPFFGPFIGAIPSVLLILVVNPIQAFYFLILIVVLQQLDGNVIGPKILGSSIGIASFWVMFAIILGGGLFGFVGMILGVPVFAVLYYYGGRFVRNKLEKKGLAEDTTDYISYNAYEINESEILGGMGQTSREDFDADKDDSAEEIINERTE